MTLTRLEEFGFEASHALSSLRSHLNDNIREFSGENGLNTAESSISEYSNTIVIHETLTQPTPVIRSPRSPGEIARFENSTQILHYSGENMANSVGIGPTESASISTPVNTVSGYFNVSNAHSVDSICRGQNSHIVNFDIQTFNNQNPINNGNRLITSLDIPEETVTPGIVTRGEISNPINQANLGINQNINSRETSINQDSIQARKQTGGQLYRNGPCLLNSNSLVLGIKDFQRIRRGWLYTCAYPMDTEDINYISHRNSLEFGSAGYCIDFEESEIIERTPPVYQTSAPSNLYMSNLPLDFVERSKFLSESVLALRADISHDYDDVCKIIDSIPKMLLDQKKSEFNCLSYRSTSNLAQNSLIFEQVISKYPNTILYAINLAVFGKKFATNKKPQLIERLLNLYLKLENFNCVYHLNALIYEINLIHQRRWTHYNIDGCILTQVVSPSLSNCILNRSAIFSKWDFSVPEGFKLVTRIGPPLFFNTIREGMPYSIEIPFEMPRNISRLISGKDCLALLQYFLVPSLQPPDNLPTEGPNRYSSNCLQNRNDPVSSGYWPIKPGHFFFAPSLRLQWLYRSNEVYSLNETIDTNCGFNYLSLSPFSRCMSSKICHLRILNPTVYARTPRLIQLAVLKKNDLSINGLIDDNLNPYFPVPFEPMTKGKDEIICEIRKALSSENGQNQDDICTYLFNVSLKCPILLTRLKRPIKLDVCKHFQCFDESVLAQLQVCNDFQSYYKCPICSKTSSKYFIDGLFLDIMDALPNANKALINTEDGTWSAVNGDNSCSNKILKDGISSEGEDSDGYDSIMRNRKLYDFNEQEALEMQINANESNILSTVYPNHDDSEENRALRRRTAGDTVFNSIVID